MIPEFDIYVYDKNLNFIGIIDFFSSLRWRRKYYDYGEFELHIPINDQTKKFLAKDNIIIREDAIEAGIIESIKISDDSKKVEATVIGRFLSSILTRRIVKKRINFNGKILDGERKILSEMTPFSKLEIKTTAIESNSIVFQCTYKNVGDYLLKLSKTSTIAHRIIPDLKRKKYIYENYQGLDRTETQSTNPRYEFSEDKGNIEKADYTYDSKSEKNFALVGGQGEGDARILVEVKSGNYSDFDLRETFVDAKSESNSGLTTSQYNEVLKTKGKENLSNPVESMEVTAYATDYKTGWDLGDIVNTKKESWGKSLKKRIVEIEETIENSNQKIYATFGDPLAETFSEKED